VRNGAGHTLTHDDSNRQSSSSLLCPGPLRSAPLRFSENTYLFSQLSPVPLRLMAKSFFVLAIKSKSISFESGITSVHVLYSKNEWD
jgi:hypothetical protein